MRELERAGQLDVSMGRDVRYAFNALWQLRLRTQLEAGLALRSDQDALPLAQLGPIERETMRAILVAIQSFQRKLSYDFCGVDLVG